MIEGPQDPKEQEADHPGRIARARANAQELQRRALDELEVARTRHASVRLATEAFESDRARAGGLLAGGLAYRVFLWEIPFALLLVSAFGLVSELAGKDPAELARSSGMTAALAGAIAQAVVASDEGRIWLLVLGGVLTVWAGRGVYRGARLVSELAWGVPGARASSLRGSLAVTGFALGGLALQGLLPKITEALGVPGPLHFVLGLVLVSATTTWMLSLLPRGDAPWTAAVPGGVLFGVGIRLLGLAASTYFAYRLDRSDDLYGSISIAVVMMLYLFILARLFVAAQFLNATLHRRKAMTAAGD